MNLTLTSSPVESRGIKRITSSICFCLFAVYDDEAEEDAEAGEEADDVSKTRLAID